MRVLISTVGSRGEVQPVVALARALAGRGYEAVVVGPPDFRSWAEGLGAEYRPVGPELRGTARRVPGPPPTEEQRRAMIAGTVDAQFDALLAVAPGCGAVVGGGALAIAAGSVAEFAGARYSYAAFAPVTLPAAAHPPPAFRGVEPGTWEQDAERWNLLWAEPLNARRAALGLAPVADVRAHLFTASPLLAADPVLAPWPEPGGPVRQTGAWQLLDPRPLPAEVLAFLDAGEPPIFAGFGSMPEPSGAAEALLGAARALGRRLIVSAGWSGFTVDAPDCLLVGELDLRQLFPRVAAAVHHGGAGTTTTAAAAGVPQVVLPQIFDQFYFADRVATLGIGVPYTVAPESDSLTSALSAALDSTARARAVAREIRPDGAQLAADLITAG
ncbi:nucleotide disphospho-sugar-binding domain-containing protein [Nocardia sp. NPDC050697]|uniref:nucleotide disphospho-sugar-binding domain-containing protein n=1 Tax=Nocardia sp. NPDC050697 TaxID=3155158 RepID=UPI0033F8A06C